MNALILPEFEAAVKEIAAGRPYSVILTTTETAASDGAGIKTLMWHAWIAGHRSVYSCDAHNALDWLRDGTGNVDPLRPAATAEQYAEASALGWVAKGSRTDLNAGEVMAVVPESLLGTQTHHGR